MVEAIVIVVVVIVLGLSFRYCLFCKPVSYIKPRILMYHMISNHIRDARFNGLRVKPDMFEKQLSHLRKEGWQSLTMRELLEGKDSVPEKTVVITFDDGYEDNFTTALPLLKQYGFKATLYLVVDRHDRDWSVKRKKKNNTGELKREPKLSDEQVKRLAESGVFEIASHTMTHPNLSDLTRSETRVELEKSKLSIEDLIGFECESFCYPFGIKKDLDWKSVSEAGYTNATTTEPGISDLSQENVYLLKRITVSGKDNLYAFRSKLKNGKRGVF